LVSCESGYDATADAAGPGPLPEAEAFLIDPTSRVYTQRVL